MSDFSDNLNQVMVTLQQLQLENQILRESLRELHTSISTNSTSLVLENFPEFLVKLEATFGERDRQPTILKNLYSLQQGSRPTPVYAS